MIKLAPGRVGGGNHQRCKCFTGMNRWNEKETENAMKTKSLRMRIFSVMMAIVLLTGVYTPREASAQDLIEYGLLGALVTLAFSLGSVINGVSRGDAVVPLVSISGHGTLDTMTRKRIIRDASGAETEQIDRIDVRLSGELVASDALVLVNGVYHHQVRAIEVGRNAVKPRAEELFTDEAVKGSSLLLLDEATGTRPGDTCLSAEPIIT